MGKNEDFPISPEVVEKYISQNTGKWRREKKENKIIYINLSMVRLQIPWIFPKILYALGAAEAAGCCVKVITWRENVLLQRFLASMDLEQIVLETIDRKNIIAGIKAFFKTMAQILFDGSPEGLKKLRIDNVPVGCSIYEDILRTSSLSTIRNTRNMICVKKIFHLMWMLLSVKVYLRKNPPILCVADDIAYHEEALLGLFQENGSRIFNVSAENEEIIRFNKKKRIIRRGESQNRIYLEKIKETSDDIIPKAEAILAKRFRGENGREIDRGAFKNKEVKDRDVLIHEMRLDEEKKNVVIMAHTFTDAIYNYGEIYFRDYYDWLEQTLKIAREIRNVNWLLKPHPTRKSYHEGRDSVEGMFERYADKHMKMIPDQVSTETIKNLADVIITIGGSAGGEFACFGIPAVIVGKPYYSGFGYTIEPNTRQEYETVLRRIEQVKRLSEDQIKIAKKVFYLKNGEEWSELLFQDDLSALLQSKYGKMQKEMALQYFENNTGTAGYNSNALESVIEYMQNNDVRKCEYYQRGKKRMEEIRNV